LSVIHYVCSPVCACFLIFQYTKNTPAHDKKFVKDECVKFTRGTTLVCKATCFALFAGY